MKRSKTSATACQPYECPVLHMCEACCNMSVSGCCESFCHLELTRVSAAESTSQHDTLNGSIADDISAILARTAEVDNEIADWEAAWKQEPSNQLLLKKVVALELQKTALVKQEVVLLQAGGCQCRA
eukprot:jgi/Chrzof1/11544/UNPLg00480.t1